MANSHALLSRGLTAIRENDPDPPETNDWSLTWGFEFEFLLAYTLPADVEAQIDALCADDPHPDRTIAMFRLKSILDVRAHSMVVTRLREAGLSNGVNEVCEDGVSYDNSRWTVSRDGSVGATDEESDQNVHKFANGQVLDNAVHGKVVYTDVEVMSPVLSAAPTSVGESLQQVKIALEAIKSLPTMVNESCGYHVHVGNRDRGYGQDTIKNLMILMTMAQNQFNQIHPLHRLMSEYCILPDRAFEPRERLPHIMCKKIEECINLTKLVQMFGTERYDRRIYNHHWAVNLLNLTGRPDRRTVEWRAHRGTLEFQEVGRWAMLASILLCKSNSINNPYYGLDQYVTKEDYGLLELLVDMDLDPCRQDYEGSLFNHPRNLVLPDPFGPDD